jgi:hypothetical protein
MRAELTIGGDHHGCRSVWRRAAVPNGVCSRPNTEPCARADPLDLRHSLGSCIAIAERVMQAHDAIRD